MCGILGVITRSYISRNECVLSIEKLKHRGPDNNVLSKVKIIKGCSVFFGHTRLAIQDLSDMGQQPMYLDDSRYAIIFNGEVYNFNEIRKDLIRKGINFSSNSDTEVVLRSYIEYGVECVQKFSGMFVFAILDSYLGTITIARDRFGKKPFYYYLDSNTFIFASELTALLEFKQVKNSISVDHIAIQQILVMGFISGTRTIFSGIKKLEPASIAVLTIESLTFTTQINYWSLLNHNSDFSDIDNYEEKINDQISQSVKERLISDSPVCMFLSGGVDSSIVYSQALQFSPELPAFTISYPDYDADESIYAQKISDELGGHLTKVELDNDSFKRSFDELLNVIDEPIADAAMIPLNYLSEYVAKDYKVALSGDGGDEIFGGYIKYLVQEYIEKIPCWLRLRIAKQLNKSNSCNFKRLASGLMNSFCERQFIFGSGGFLPEGLEAVLAPDFSYKKKQLFEDVCNAPALFPNEPYRQSMYLDTLFQLPDWYLYKADRSTMLNGLELRSPLLDHRLAELSFSAPLSNHRLFLYQKKLLKKKLAKKVSRNLVYRKKLGFAVNLDSIISSSWATDLILAETHSEVFNKDYLIKNLKMMPSLAKFKLLTINSYLLRQGF